MPYIEQEAIRNKKYTTGGGTTAYTVTMPNTPALYDGLTVTVKMNATNTGSSTLNVNGLGAKTIKKPGVTNLSSGDLLINSVYTFVYDLSQDFFFLSRVVFTTTVAGGGLPTNTISMLAAFGGMSGRDNNTPINTARVGFIETASFVYAAFALFSINNNDDEIFYKMGVQKFDKTTQALVATYISDTIENGFPGFGVLAADTYLRSDTTLFYAVFQEGGTYYYFTFDTATDTFSANAAGATIDFGILNMLSSTSSADSTLAQTDPTYRTSALTAGANPGADSPDTLTVGSGTYGITYYYSLMDFSGTDAVSSSAVIAFVTYT